MSPRETFWWRRPRWRSIDHVLGDLAHARRDDEAAEPLGPLARQERDWLPVAGSSRSPALRLLHIGYVCSTLVRMLNRH